VNGPAERQAYALIHPLTDPDRDSTAPYTTVRVHARGFLLLSVLAVDR
jgi:hypothetical protein